MVCLGLVHSNKQLLHVDWSVDRSIVEAGEAVTFRVTAEFARDYSATLFNNEVGHIQR